MALDRCLALTGFTREEMQAIRDDIAGGNAAEVVREHIAALEAERADIIRQATPEPAKAEPAPGKDAKPDMQPMYVEQERQLLDQFPDLMMPGEDGKPAPMADLLAQANLDIETAKKNAGLYDVAVACFLGGGA